MKIIKRNINEKIPIWFTIGETTFSGEIDKEFLKSYINKKGKKSWQVNKKLLLESGIIDNICKTMDWDISYFEETLK